MKSIMEEGASIFKAVEKAWSEAGKPQHFTVKIFEDAQKNLFGFVSKKAKIALFFNNEKKEVERPVQPRASKKPRVPQQKELVTQERTERLERPTHDAWSPDMVEMVRDWLTNCLKLLGLPNIIFTTQIAGNHLRVHFDTSVTGNSAKERVLFRSFAYLIMQTVRNKCKKKLRFLKVVLQSP